MLLASLTACASDSTIMVDEVVDKLNLPRQVIVVETDNKAAKSIEKEHYWQVVAQREGHALRWLRFNVLGAPDARQILQNGKWRNDGFIAPNKQAQELFAALLFAWIKAADLPRTDVKTAWRCDYYLDFSEVCMDDNGELKENRRIRWAVRWANRLKADEFSIEATRNNATIWRVQPITEQ